MWKESLRDVPTSFFEIFLDLIFHVVRDFEVEGVEGDDNGTNICVDNIFHVAEEEAAEKSRVVELGEFEKIVNCFVFQLVVAHFDVSFI